MSVQKYQKNGEIIPRILSHPETSFFLFGPRGTGKSTWLRAKFAQALWIDLLQPDQFQKFMAHPAYLRELIEGQPNKSVIIIDEIQRIPELLSLIHALIEEKKEKQFILTGSSARKLKRTGVDLLAGRAILCQMHPFIAAELGDDFNLDQALELGLLPLVVTAKNPSKILKAYLALYIREEVQQEGLTRNLANFTRFLEAISFSQGSVINTNNISRECLVERKTVERYIGILIDLLIAFRLPVFTKRARREIIAHDKFYFFDAGVYRFLRPQGPLDQPQELDGIALETLVFQHLKAWNSTIDDEHKIYYWRTKHGIEVDFIIYGKKYFLAIEVKNTSKIRQEDLKGLKAFLNDYPESRGVFLYRGTDQILRDKILCMPCESFLKKLNKNFKL